MYYYNLYHTDKRFILTASYANCDKTAPEYYISDLLTHRREQIDTIDIAKSKLRKLVTERAAER